MYRARARRESEGGGCHGDLVDVVPVGAEGHLEGVAEVYYQQVRVDQVPVGVLRDADAAVVGPGARVHGCGCCDANSRVLTAASRDGVVEVVSSVDVGDVGGP